MSLGEKMKKISLILLMIFLILIVYLKIFIEQNNLILMDKEEKNIISKSIHLVENIESFKPIRYKKERIELSSSDRLKVIIFNISKKDYYENNLQYSDNRTPELDQSIKIDRGDYYECQVYISKLNVVYEYEEINPKSKINESIDLYLRISLAIIVVLFIIRYILIRRNKERKI